VRSFLLGYFSGDTSLLVDDVTILKPTVFPGVPRVWQRIYDRINAKIADVSSILRRICLVAVLNSFICTEFVYHKEAVQNGV
jgi:long-chain acyl-CoA synthetase